MKITNQNIILRDWEKPDLETYLKWNSGHHRWMDFNGPYYPKKTTEEVLSFIKKCQLKIDSNDWKIPRQRMVIAEVSTNQLIGTVSWYWQSEETNWKSIDIAIYDDKQWGKNIGFEALQLWISYLFTADKTLVRLDLRTWSGNIGMMNLATKLGFREEARFRKARIVNGAYFDSIGMGILREEWQQLFQ